jgi:hypothetical protein
MYMPYSFTFFCFISVEEAERLSESDPWLGHLSKKHRRNHYRSIEENKLDGG